jgi:hypothetical protein
MGMQCTFSASDLEERTETKIVHDLESDTYIIECVKVGLSFNLINREDTCWFDCGRGNFEQMVKIQWLIHNRIPFTCA